MEVNIVLISCIFVLQVTFTTSNLLRDEIWNLFSNAKADLARSFLEKELEEKDGTQVVNVTPKHLEELNVPDPGKNVRIFRSADENFLFTGADLFQLQKRESPSGRYYLNVVDDLRLGEGAVFFKNAEWKNKMFLVVCYQMGFCEIRVSAPALQPNLKLRINTGTLPLDVTFFGTEDEFFMIMVLDPVTIYRWTGTYFNEDYRLDTTGAQSVAVIKDGDKFIIVVAQNLGMYKVYSKVFVRHNDKIELLQLLPTHQALRVLPFDLVHGQQVLHFIFVLNNVHSSTIFWWTGKEFLLWKTLDKLYGQRIVYVGEMESEIFFFVSNQNNIYIYYPTTTSFDLTQIIQFDQNVVGLDLRKEKGEMPMLVALTGSPIESYFKVNLILLKVAFKYVEKPTKQPSGIEKCLSELKVELDARRRQLDDVFYSVIKETDPGEYGIVQEASRNKETPAENLVVAPLTEVMIELAQKVEELEGRIKDVQRTTNLGGGNRKYHVHGNLTIDRMEAEVIDVEILNGRKADLGNILSLTRDQTFLESIEMDTLETDALEVKSVNGVAFEDIMLRNKSLQRISGDFTLDSLKVNDIKFGPAGRLNQIPTSDIVTNGKNGKVIRGPKIFSKLKAREIEVNKINNVPAKEWLAKILPTLNDATKPLEPLNFTSLTVEKLWVSRLNGIPWEDLVRSSYLLTVQNGTIIGNVSVRGTAKIDNLKTKKINGIVLSASDVTEGRSMELNKGCKFEGGVTKTNFVPSDLISDWNDSFLSEILNDPESEFENDIKYFSDKQTLNGDIRVTKVFVKNPVVLSGKEINLGNLTQRFWMKNQDQTIDVPVVFAKGFSVSNSLKVTSINGLALDSFARIDRSNQITSEIVFENPEITGNVHLFRNTKQNVNLRELNETTVKALGKNVVSGTKRFLGKLTAKRVNVNLVNGADVDDLGNLIRESHNASGNLDVSELIIGGDLLLKNGVQVDELNGKNFDETTAKILKWTDPDALSKAHYKSLNVENLHADIINGVNIEDKLPALSKSHERNVSVIIEGSLQIPSLRAKTLNGINFDKFTRQVFMKSESQTIRGEKTFLEPVTVTENLEGNLNGYNVTDLARLGLSKSKPQEITGTFTVEEFKANDVEADYVDGVPTGELLFQDETSEQIINSDVVFNSLAVAGDIKSVNFMNECDLDKASNIKFEEMNNFENLVVRGPVTWDLSTDEPGGLNYFINNVVTKDRKQKITGSVTFLNDVTAHVVDGSRHINDVDVGRIFEDTIFKSRQHQEISTSLTFKGPVKINSIDVHNNVLVDTINDIDITDIDQRLVKKSVDTIVSGRKYFKNGFTANHFNADFINGRQTSQVVFYDYVNDNKELYLPRSTFWNLNIFNDLTVTRVNGHRLNRILEERLSKTEEGESSEGNHINGTVVVEGDVIIRGDALFETLNGVSINETISTSDETSSGDVFGDVEILQNLSILGELQVDFINGKNISELYEKALMVDEDAVIDGNLKFLSNLTVVGDISANKTYNNCDLNRVTHSNAFTEPDSFNQEYRDALRAEVNRLSNITATMSKPVVFMYLEETAKLDLQLPSIHSSTFNQYDAVSEFNVHGMKQGRCGLPKECYCPVQTNVVIESLTPPVVKVEANSTRFFKYYDSEMRVEVMVTTTTVSYSSRCRKPEEEYDSEYTSISWRKDDETIYEPKIETGFLSDVKYFKLGDSIYVVMAFYFHPFVNQTNNLHTVVYEINVNDNKLEKVDEIPSTGVQVLEVFWTMKGVILVVGNSFDSERFTDSVNSGVYRFNEYRNKFELLRFVKTHGILSIKSMRYKKQSFIFFVQKQTWPLLILKYNPEYDNYYFSQKLDTTRAMIRSNFVSVSVIYTGVGDYVGDVFIGIVLSDDSFRLFKYRHIEGFVEESYQEQNNVRILHPFWMGSSQYVLSGSAMSSSKIYKIIEQGR